MPPESTKKPLTDQDREILRQWVADGAEYPLHWGLVAPQRSPVPTPRHPSWSRYEIDRFVLARIEAESLAPSPEADRLTLLRRLTLDLTGLPPTVAEVEAFTLDNRPEAYDEAMERLLASPHYGERWGRLWLDGARYADSDGYEKDKPRFVWAYRDWVVGALNRDLPYDQFIIEQIAGDMLPDATQDQVVATGFLCNSMLNEEGGIDPEQFRMEAMFDRMDAIGKNVLGVTIQCCQCHNHKYDPIAQEEYYRMFAFLNDTDERIAAVYPPDELARRGELLGQIAAIERELASIACPTGRTRWPSGKERFATSVGCGPSYGRLSTPAAGRSITCSKTARSWPRVMPPRSTPPSLSSKPAWPVSRPCGWNCSTIRRSPAPGRAARSKDRSA